MKVTYKKIRNQDVMAFFQKHTVYLKNVKNMFAFENVLPEYK